MGGAPAGGGILEVDSTRWASAATACSRLVALTQPRARAGAASSRSGAGAQSSFHGGEGALSLGGDVRTTMFGTDYPKGPLVVGLSLARSEGLGDWLSYRLNERVSVGVTGYGTGGLLLTPQGGPPVDAMSAARHPGQAGRGQRRRLWACVDLEQQPTQQAGRDDGQVSARARRR